MRTPSSALVALLSGNAGVSAIVANRIFVGRVQQAVDYPCIVIVPVSGRSEEDLTSVGGQHSYRVTVEARSESSLQADLLGAAICAALDDYTGPSAGLSIDRIRRASEAFLDDQASKIFRRAIDFHVYFA